jgi:hypothetical protein
MFQPLEIKDRTGPAEYINRVKPADHGHSSASRDFSLEIKEAANDEKRHRQPSPEFGEDRYEPEQDKQLDSPDPASVRERPDESAEADRNLDITV